MSGKPGAVLLGLLLVAQALAAGAVVAGEGGASPAASRPAAVDGGERAAGRDISYALPAGFLSPITPERMSAVVGKLESFGTRYVYTERAADAADYIEREFWALGLEPSRQDFLHNSYMMSNVLAVLPGRNASLPALVLGAHYDSLNGTDSLLNPYAPAPGADDDGSGVAAVLAIAEAFSRARTERTIIFAAFDGEEVGRAGSIEFVRQARAAAPGIYAGLVFDMIGYNHRFPKVDLVTNRGSQWLAGHSAEAGRLNLLGIGTEHVVTPDNPQNWSDHVSFWEAGLPAMCFIEDENPTVDSPYFEANPNYHSAQDTLENLNATLMAKVARLGAATAAALAGFSLHDIRVDSVDRPAEVFEGDSFDVEAFISSTGSPGAYPVNVSLEVDGARVARSEALQDGRLNLSWNATRGSHVLSVVADSDDRHLEWNQTDNRLSFTLEVRVRPDLRLEGFWATDDSPVPGGRMALVVLVENRGGTTGAGRVVIHPEGSTGSHISDRPVTVPPGDLSVVICDAVAPSSLSVLRAEVRDVRPAQNHTEGSNRSLTVTPDVLDPGDFRIVIEPDVVATGGTVTVGVEGAPPGFDWFIDFGDGRSAGWTGSPSSHFYPRSGTYLVGVTLRDAKGAVADLERMPVTVADRPPVAVMETRSTVVAPGTTVAFSGGRSFDPDGEVVAHLWDFGEGAKGFGSETSHTYSTEGRYRVRLTVTDDGQQGNTTVLDLEVVNRPPAARVSAGSRLLFAGESAALDGAGSRDPDGSVASYLWDFGDGSNSTGPLAGHVFKKEGNYSVTLTVTDDRGAANSTTVELTVLKRLPPLDIRSPRQPDLLVPALLATMVLIAIVLVLRSRQSPSKDEEE